MGLAAHKTGERDDEKEFSGSLSGSLVLKIVKAVGLEVATDNEWDEQKGWLLLVGVKPTDEHKVPNFSYGKEGSNKNIPVDMRRQMRKAYEQVGELQHNKVLRS